MKVKMEAANAFFYPNVFVTCDERDHQADVLMTSPKLIVEMLSDSTAAFDRGDKLAIYRQIPTLEEYLLIDTGSQRADCFRRDATGHWMLYDFGKDDVIEPQSILFRAPLVAFFENIRSSVREG